VIVLLESEMGKTDAKIIEYFPPLQLKGIRNMQVIRNRHLAVETSSQLAVYYIWDVVDGRDKFTGAMKEEGDRIPKCQQVLRREGF
jgi:hypothetical protein